MDRTVCTMPKCLYSTAIPLFPYGPNGLYSTPIPLLPLCAVQLVQSLNSCTVELYFFSPYWPYYLYRTSMPVKYSCNSTPPIGRTACTEPQCLYSRAILLLPLLTVRPEQSLSACTVQLYVYSPIGLTVCTEPQCL